jgi:hypothetical protein
MKTWYKAVCDTHKEMCDIFVNNPLATAHLLGDKNEDIHQWLSLHYNCDLRLIHHDEDNEKCWEKGYADIFMDDFLNRVKKKL